MLAAAGKHSDAITRLSSVRTKAHARVPYLLVAHGCNLWSLLVKVLKQRKWREKIHRMSRGQSHHVFGLLKAAAVGCGSWGGGGAWPRHCRQIPSMHAQADFVDSKPPCTKRDGESALACASVVSTHLVEICIGHAVMIQSCQRLDVFLHA